MRMKKCFIFAFSIVMALNLPVDRDLGYTSSASAGAPVVPLMLLSEPVQEGGNSGGVPADGGGKGVFWDSGFVAYLEENGYKPGENLFIFTPPSSFWDLSSGAATVKDFLDDVALQVKKAREKRLNEAASVVDPSQDFCLDVICYGVSGLVMRWSIEKGYIPDGLVRNLIMLDAPNRGSFVAGFLKSFSEVARAEYLWEKETRTSRYAPLGRIEAPWDREVTGEKELMSLAGDPVTLSKSWQSEANWISQRVTVVYEPLYAKYVKSRYLSVPYVYIDSPQETFPGWIKKNYPTFFDVWIQNAVLPPQLMAQSQAGDFQYEPGNTGYDLSLAYYETVAMDVARNQYVLATHSENNLVETLVADGHVPMSFKDALRYYGIKILAYYAGQALVTIKAELKTRLVDKILAETGFSTDPESPFLRRLINEDILLNLGTSQNNWYQRISANYFLKSMNSEMLDNASSRLTRYVLISGAVSNFWKLIWPTVAPNNWFCEVDSAVSPSGPGDLVRVFSGILSPSHLSLLKNGGVRDFIKKVISGDAIVEENWVKVPGDSEAVPPGSVRISSWQPSYLRVGLSDQSGPQVISSQRSRGVTVDLQLPGAQDGWAYAVWLEETTGAGAPDGLDVYRTVQGSLFQVPGGGTFQVELKNPDTERIGLRLMREGPINPVIGRGSVESSFVKEVSATGELLGVHFLPAETDGSSVEESTQTPEPKGAETEESTSMNLPAGEARSDEDIPEISVVYRSKHTTLKKPSETYHTRWLLNYGDGSQEEISGSPMLKVSHFYASPGFYEFSAVSYDNRGEIIFEKRSKIEVQQDAGEKVEFELRSIPQMMVQVYLKGPKMWITGKPALYEVEASYQVPSWARVEEISIDPGEKFEVIWKRAGDFTVSCAVTIKAEYDLGDKKVTVTNTYLKEVTCKVMTGSITQ